MTTFINKHILIVDDDESVLKTLARYLRKRGYRISTASGGKEALEKIAKEPPHLVLLDALMPEMDGIETLEQIRLKFPDIDVVMISALKEEVVAQGAIKMGAYEWIPKPFSMQHLEATLYVGFLRKMTSEPSQP